MLGAVSKSLLVMYFCPPLLVMTAETMYPRSSAIMTCTHTQAKYCQHLSSIACWSAELLSALINIATSLFLLLLLLLLLVLVLLLLSVTCAVHVLTRLWQMPVSLMGLNFAMWSNLAHASRLLSVVYIMQLQLQQVTLFHGTTTLQQQDTTSC